MNILITGPAYPYRGGIAAYNERLAEQFLLEGHQVELATFKMQYPRILFPGKTQYVSGNPPRQLTILRVLHSMNPLNWFIQGLKYRKKRYDLVIVRYWLPFMAPCLGTFARLLRRRSTRVVALIDNMVPHEKRPGDRLLSRYFVRSVDGFTVMSRKVEEELYLFDKKKPRLRTPHPLFDNFGIAPSREEALKALDLSGEYRYFLFFGFIRKYKGLDLLLEAFAHPSVERSKYRLLVAGEFYTAKEPYLKQISRLGLADQVYLFDRFIPNGEVRLFFAAADLVIQPYRDATQSGVSQIAYHFEKPMIVSDVGGLGELMAGGKAGYTVKPAAGAIAEAIVSYQREEDKNRYISHIRDIKKRFSWEKLTEGLLQLAAQINK